MEPCDRTAASSGSIPREDPSEAPRHELRETVRIFDAAIPRCRSIVVASPLATVRISCDGGLLLGGQTGSVQGETAKICDESREAVPRKVLPCGLGSGLAFGRRGNLGHFDRRVALRPRRGRVVVQEQQWSQPLSDMPCHVVGEHAQG